MKRYNAVIFDVDGTLLDTTEGVLNAVRYTISTYGLPQLDENMLKTFIGPPIQESFGRAYGLDRTICQELATIFRKHYKDKELLKAKPYEGIYRVFERLVQAQIKIAIATYKRQDYAKELLEHFGFDRYTNIIYGSDHENRLKKKDIIELCLRECQIVHNDRVLMIGDSEHDALGAEGSGIDFLGVTYGFDFRSKEDVMRCQAIGAAAAPEEILSYLI